MSIPYDPRSTRAEEFINDEEVLASLAYGEENKNNAALIDQLLDKVMTFKGLTHREAAVLLANDDPEVTKRIFDAAIKVKEHIYGKRIVLFAPLYLSNYCINGCTYCPYHAKNKHIVRKKLTMEEIEREVIALQDSVTSVCFSKRANTRSTTRSNTSLTPSRRFIRSSTRTAPSAASTSTSRQRP